MTEDVIVGGTSIAPPVEHGGALVPGGSWFNEPTDSGKEAMKPLVRFTGSGWELFSIHIGNYLLSILTLGVYSFWARARVRRYLWGNIEILGENLEYNGTGGELFRSFLLIVLLGGVFAGILFAFSLLTPFLSAAVLSVVLVPVGHFASHRALRYRLTRTRWRGIRGNLYGSSVVYALRGSGYTFLSMLTLFLCVPLETARLVSRRLNAFFFGSRRASFSGSSKPLFVRWIGTYILLTVFASGGIIVFLALSQKDFQAIAQSSPGLVHVLVLAGGLAGAALYGISSVIYRAAVVRWTFENLSFGAMRFNAEKYTAWSLLRLRVANCILLVITLGLAYPWTEIRSLRFFLSSVRYTGDPDLKGLLQDTLPDAARGEGLLDALDMDISL